QSGEVGAEGEAVAVHTVGAGGVPEVGDERGRAGPPGAEGALQRHETGRGPGGPLEIRVLTVGRLLGLQGREEREPRLANGASREAPELFPQKGRLSACRAASWRPSGERQKGSMEGGGGESGRRDFREEVLLITKLKIDRNPFAKGFRDPGRN
ncbi:hypothetical protein CRUP_030727, partial [Coryphaenoides rupestris]